VESIWRRRRNRRRRRRRRKRRRRKVFLCIVGDAELSRSLAMLQFNSIRFRRHFC